MKKSDFMEMFKYNELKLRILREKVTTETTTVYRCVPPDNKLVKEWKQFQEEAVKRNHRKIGVQQDVFFFHELSPGAIFFQPKELTFTARSSPS